MGYVTVTVSVPGAVGTVGAVVNVGPGAAPLTGFQKLGMFVPSPDDELYKDVPVLFAAVSILQNPPIYDRKQGPFVYCVTPLYVAYAPTTGT